MYLVGYVQIIELEPLALNILCPVNCQDGEDIIDAVEFLAGKIGFDLDSVEGLEALNEPDKCFLPGHEYH